MSLGIDNDGLLGIDSAEDEPEIPKIYDYFVTVTGGLEDVALREIKSTLRGVSQIHVNKRQRQGRIHFRYERSPKRSSNSRQSKAYLPCCGSSAASQQGVRV